MYNPLLENVTKLKDPDLEKTILDLTKKYQIAARFSDPHVCDQIIIALSAYREELQRRQAESTQKMLKKQDKGLDDLINVD